VPKLERALDGAPAGTACRYQGSVNIEQQDGWFHAGKLPSAQRESKKQWR
jgi:hypothetical protein